MYNHIGSFQEKFIQYYGMVQIKIKYDYLFFHSLPKIDLKDKKKLV